MNIYLYELKSLKKSTAIWTLSMITLAALYFSVFPAIAKDASGFKALMSGYPESVRAMLGISLDNIASPLGYYSMFFSFISLCGAVQAMNFGISILSKESRERTADFLLVKPVSRSTIVTSKLLAAFTMLIITNAVYIASAFVVATIVKNADFSIWLFLMLNITMFFIQLIFLSIGMFVSVFFRKLKTVLPVSLGVVFGLYIGGALLVTEQDDAVRFLSPFKYFDLQYILNNSGFEIAYLITGALVIISAITVSYVIYTKKDIHAVS